MNHFLGIIFTNILMLVSVTVAAACPPEEIILTCRGGDITVRTIWKEGRYQGATARGIINAPPEIVWKIISDYNHSQEFMPNIIRSRAICRKGNKVWTRTIVGMGIFRVKFYAQSTERKDIRELAWRQLRGPFTTDYGKWVVKAAGPGISLLTYQNNLDHVLIPEWIRNYLIRKSLPMLCKAIRNRAHMLQQEADIALDESVK